MHKSIIAALIVLVMPVMAQPTHLDSLAHFDVQPLGSYSAIWGYTAPDGREYALLGVNGRSSAPAYPGGTSIIDVTNTDSVRQVAFINGPNSSWREMKTFRNYAYVVTEAGGGVQIIKLAELPDTARLVRTFNFTSGTKNILRTHSISIHDGFMYLNGCANWSPGGAVIFDLRTDPENPVFAGEYQPDYFHDVYVLRDTLYGSAIYSGGGLYIADARNKSSITPIGKISYSGSGTHNAWVTKDRQFVLTTDEIGATAKDLKFWRIATLPTIPVSPTTTYTPSPADIVHNVTIRGDYAYVAWYTAGLQVVNITNPGTPSNAGGFDTSTEAPGSYNGVWGVYPYFPSGKIIAGDMQNGLWVFRFSDLAARQPVDLLNPSDAATVTSLSPLAFRWTRTASPSKDPHWYVLHVNGPGVNMTVTAPDSTYTLNDFTGFQSNQAYTWHVRTLDEFNDTASQDTFSFVYVDAIPAVPALVSPSNGATEQPTDVTLLWSTSQFSSSYDVQLSQNPSFTSLLVNDSLVSGTSRFVPSLSYAVEYHWRVRGRNAEYLGSWSGAFSFEVTPTGTFSYPVVSGWNMISVPLGAQNPARSALFPTSTSHAYAFDPSNGYVQRDSLVEGVGYWLKFPSAGNVSLTGDVRRYDTIYVREGWNIVGSLSDALPVVGIQQIPAGIVQSAYFGYTGTGYASADTLLPAASYWVKVSQDGMLLFDATAAPTALRAPPLPDTRIQLRSTPIIEMQRRP